MCDLELFSKIQSQIVYVNDGEFIFKDYRLYFYLSPDFKYPVQDCKELRALGISRLVILQMPQQCVFT